MKALVLERYLSLAYKEVPRPVIGPEEVLIRVKACAICGSDVHGYDGSTGRRLPEVIMGHEAAGVIEEAGAGVIGYAAGDRVAFDSTVYCGRCWFCTCGRFNLCDNRRVLGVHCADYKRDGAMADYAAVPGHILYKLPDAVTFEQAAMVEPLSVALHAVKNASIVLNDTAVVYGAGTIGLLIIQALKLSGCRVIAVDLDQGKLDMALALGADYVLLSDGDVQGRILALTERRGCDLAFDAVGIHQTFNNAISSVRKGGQVIMVGNLSAKVDFNLQNAVVRELRLQGTCASAGEYETCLDLIGRGRINVDALISATAPMAEGAKWFDALRAGQAGLTKVVLVNE